MVELKRRRLGRTGLAVAELGLGAMDTPQSAEGAETLRAALDEGIDFVDTARDYAGSEFLIGQVVRERGRLLLPSLAELGLCPHPRATRAPKRLLPVDRY